MAKEDHIREELLKEMERNSDKAAEANTNSAQEIIAKEKARVRRTKWETVIAWVLVVVCFTIGAVVERFEMVPYFSDVELMWFYCLPMILRALVLIAVIFSVLLYTRSRSLTIRQIQARLASIEAILKQMAED